MTFFNKNKKKKLTVPFLFVIDGSEGMRGDKAERLDRVFPKIIDVIENRLEDAVGVFSVLRVSENAEWISKAPISPKKKDFAKITASGEYNLATALECIDQWLSEEFSQAKKANYKLPAIVFITASAPKKNYIPALEKLKKNPLFRHSIKIAITLDRVALDSMDAIFGSESIVHTETPEDIPNILSNMTSLLYRSVKLTASSPSVDNESLPLGNAFNCEEFDPKKTESIFDKERESFKLSLSPDEKSGDPDVTTGFEDLDVLFYDDVFDVSDKSTDTPVSVSQVQFSAISPKQLLKGEYAMIDITVYEDAYRNIVDKIIENADTEVKETVASPRDIKENTRVRIRLSSPDVDISDCDEEQIWRGKYLTYSFPIEIPRTYAKKNILFIASVYFNGIIATKLKFIASCTTEIERKLSITREDVLTAFVSYASQDRSRVATIIQGMKKARPDMDVFFDVESLRSGENWETRVYSEIEKRDVLFLCWSEFAKKSEWVDKEWRYALSYKGIDAIEPIPLVPPSKCPPPEELGSKHFNDTALLYS